MNDEMYDYLIRFSEMIGYSLRAQLIANANNPAQKYEDAKDLIRQITSLPYAHFLNTKLSDQISYSAFTLIQQQLAQWID